MNSGKWDYDRWGHPGEPGVEKCNRILCTVLSAGAGVVGFGVGFEVDVGVGDSIGDECSFGRKIVGVGIGASA